MYRAVTLAVLRAGVAVDDAAALTGVAGCARLEVSTDPGRPGISLDGLDVSAEIRTAEVTGAVSAVSAVPGVRAALVAAQREIIGEGAIVVEGRDIGSVVWPSARPKIYLTASAAVRAARRAGELGVAGAAAVAAVAADIRRRDEFDGSRAESPAVRPDGSVELDTTNLSIDEVVDLLVDITMNGEVAL
jgi:cytidylate kinase